MQCPKHPEVELRAEMNGNDRTGFCLKCLRHYPRCRHMHYMEMCNKVDGHEGLHEGIHHSTKWDVDPR